MPISDVKVPEVKLVEPVKKSKKKLYIIIFLSILLLVIGIGLVVYFVAFNKIKNDTTVASNNVASTTIVPVITTKTSSPKAEVSTDKTYINTDLDLTIYYPSEYKLELGEATIECYDQDPVTKEYTMCPVKENVTTVGIKSDHGAFYISVPHQGRGGDCPEDEYITGDKERNILNRITHIKYCVSKSDGRYFIHPGWGLEIRDLGINSKTSSLTFSVGADNEAEFDKLLDIISKITITSQRQIDVTKDWKTFTNDSLNIKIKAPTGYSIDSTNKNILKLVKNNTYLILDKNKNQKENCVVADNDYFIPSYYRYKLKILGNDYKLSYCERYSSNGTTIDSYYLEIKTKQSSINAFFHLGDSNDLYPMVDILESISEIN